MSTNLVVPAGATEFDAMGSCTTCAFVPAKLTPTDAVVALRSFPARWRGALAVHLDDPDPAATLSGRPSASGWSALEHAGHVRDVLHSLDIRLERLFREDEPVLPDTPVTPPSGANEQGAAVILAALTVSTDQFSQTVEFAPAAAWGRRGRRSGQTITALDLVREAIHEGSHHLWVATRTLSELRATSVGSS